MDFSLMIFSNFETNISNKKKETYDVVYSSPTGAAFGDKKSTNIDRRIDQIRPT